jgi:hypothetical protein
MDCARLVSCSKHPEVDWCCADRYCGRNCYSERNQNTRQKTSQSRRSAITIGSQIVEWVKTAYDAEEAQHQNVVTLSEIRRAVTRFEDIRYNVYMDLPLDDPVFKKYRGELDKRIENIVDTDVRLNQCYGGIRPLTKHTRDWENAVIGICPDGLPRKPQDGIVETLIEAIPEIALYKRSIDATSFAAFSDESVDPTADLLLIPSPSPLAPTITGSLDELETLQALFMERTGLNAPADRWSPSGDLVSVEDLVGAEALVYMPWRVPDSVEKLWKHSTLTVNSTLIIREFVWRDPRLQLRRDITEQCLPTNSRRTTCIRRTDSASTLGSARGTCCTDYAYLGSASV